MGHDEPLEVSGKDANVDSILGMIREVFGVENGMNLTPKDDGYWKELIKEMIEFKDQVGSTYPKLLGWKLFSVGQFLFEICVVGTVERSILYVFFFESPSLTMG